MQQSKLFPYLILICSAHTAYPSLHINSTHPKTLRAVHNQPLAEALLLDCQPGNDVQPLNPTIAEVSAIAELARGQRCSAPTHQYQAAALLT